MLNAAERTVIDEVAHKSFDAWTFEHEHHVSSARRTPCR
jgi:hypothetical protein